MMTFHWPKDGLTSSVIGFGVGSLWTFVICVTVPACVRVKTRPTIAKAVNPSYLELYSLSKVADETHTVEVSTPDGKRWFRTKEPVLDLRHLDCRSARALTDGTGEPWVQVLVLEQHRDMLAAWSQSHMGQWAGCVLNGKLMQVDRIKTPLRVAIGVWGFATLKEAEGAAKAIFCGGIDDAAVRTDE